MPHRRPCRRDSSAPETTTPSGRRTYNTTDGKWPHTASGRVGRVERRWQVSTSNKQHPLRATKATREREVERRMCNVWKCNVYHRTSTLCRARPSQRRPRASQKVEKQASIDTHVFVVLPSYHSPRLPSYHSFTARKQITHCAATFAVAKVRRRVALGPRSRLRPHQQHTETTYLTTCDNANAPLPPPRTLGACLSERPPGNATSWRKQSAACPPPSASRPPPAAPWPIPPSRARAAAASAGRQ